MSQTDFTRRAPQPAFHTTQPGPVAVSVSGSTFHQTQSTPPEPRHAAPEPILPALPPGQTSLPANAPTGPMRPSTAVAVDLHEAAEMLHVSAQTVRREINRGLIKGLRIGRVWRIRVSEIEAYLERMENRGKRTLRF